MATIVTYRGIEEIDETTYWHLVPASGGYSNIFFNNALVGQGLVHSISFMIELDPNLANARSPYSIANVENEKEQLFEHVRVTRFPNLPSRLRALYLFQSRELAERAQREWFPNEPKVALRAWIANGSRLHIGDAHLLNGSREKWPTNAQRYWSGEQTANPLLEVLVAGSAYFPDWQSFANPQ